MNLKIQIISLIYSFVFGVVFGVGFKLFYSFLFYKKYISYVNTFLYVLSMFFVYFLILLKINGGILHSYFFIIFFCGFLFFLYIFEKICKK